MVNKIGRKFNQAGCYYQQNAIVQQKVLQYLIQLIDTYCKKTPINTMLELGCGDGLNSLALAQKFMPKCYDGVDCADQLINKAIVNCKDLATLYFHCLNFDDNLQELPGNYDMIFANMSLHWSGNLYALLKSLKQKLSLNGYLCFSMPLQGTFSELSPYCRINQFLTNYEVHKLLYRANFKIIHTAEAQYVIDFSSKKAQLAHLRKTGVNCYLGQHRVCIKKMRQYLKQKSSTLQLSYCIGLYVLEM